MPFTLSIPEPCPQDWDTMTPAGSGRHCAVCDKVVVDLCGMPVSDARKLVEERVARGESVCGRAIRRPDGRLALGRRYVLTNGLALILAAAAGGIAADQPVPVKEVPQPLPMVAGGICPIPIPQATDPTTGTHVIASGNQLVATRKNKELWRWQPPKDAPVPDAVKNLKILEGKLHVERTSPAGTTTITVHSIETGALMPPST
ncbi:hypothetical protein LBMAG53_31880 [Planctomycetota bacterium]|nr:hypothetical protein LBMAG53_31880 [Planctomycetota bacterium]